MKNLPFHWLTLTLVLTTTVGWGAGAGTNDADLWPPGRITAAEQALDKLKTIGLISERRFEQKRTMLEARRAGRFQPTALSNKTHEELNLIQNGGFEQINRNSARNRSRWLWWGGWSWGGDYENLWESRPEYVHSGKYSARIRCTGRPGRIGLNTPKLPTVPGVKAYHFTIWAKGEGANQLFLNFESGASGSLRKRIGPQWEQVSLTGTVEPSALDFTLFIYVTEAGTIWLDDAKLVPVGKIKDE